MTAVIGIDASLTSTGMATVHDNGDHVVLHTVASTGKRADGITERAARLHGITEAVRDYVADDERWHGLALVVIEGPSMASVGGSAWDRAGVWWAIVQAAVAHAPVAVVAPTTRAKWATGSGKGDKAAIAAAMARRVPEVTIGNSDEADALALAWMGAQHLGWRPTTAGERASLAVVRWPQLTSDEE